ncbi:MAG: toxin [Balneolaceae bacterium]|nr:MAG: toxin [Balneolaceae bacterium]
MHYVWDDNKNRFLKRTRNISFERIITAIEHGYLLDILEHITPEKYPGQKLFVIEIDNYCWAIPYKDDKKRGYRKLITAFPSRKLTKKYLR